jgi:hypothetical protein
MMEWAIRCRDLAERDREMHLASRRGWITLRVPAGEQASLTLPQVAELGEGLDVAIADALQEGRGIG